MADREALTCESARDRFIRVVVTRTVRALLAVGNYYLWRLVGIPMPAAIVGSIVIWLSWDVYPGEGRV